MSPAQTAGRPGGLGTARQERRIYRRARIDAPAMLDALSSYHSGHCENVSAGGLVLYTDAEFEVGTQVELYFELPGGIAIEANAEVVRREAERLALRFIDLDHEQVVALRAYCRLSGMQPAVQ